DRSAPASRPHSVTSVRSVRKLLGINRPQGSSDGSIQGDHRGVQKPRRSRAGSVLSSWSINDQKRTASVGEMAKQSERKAESAGQVSKGAADERMAVDLRPGTGP